MTEDETKPDVLEGKTCKFCSSDARSLVQDVQRTNEHPSWRTYEPAGEPYLVCREHNAKYPVEFDVDGSIIERGQP